MADYRRTTQESSPDRLRPEIRAAIEQHIAERQLGDVLANVLYCCETANERLKKPGLLAGLTGAGDPDPVHYTAGIVTPVWLIWARSGAKYGIHATFIRLKDAEVRDYQYAHLAEDHGLDVLGFIGDAPERGSLFLGLGREAAADRFAEVLKEAARKAKE